VDFLSQHSTSIFSIRLFLDNDYGRIILQASFKLSSSLPFQISHQTGMCLKLQMMYYDGYFVDCCSNKHAQRFEILSILTQASMKT
jgi:hypothetical protein